jgi:hypothetical protein
MRKTILTLAAATLFASLTASATLAAETRGFPSYRAPMESAVTPQIPCKLILLSDGSAGIDFVYKNVATFPAYSPMPTLPAADDGWGIYAWGKGIVAGAAPNQINFYEPCSANAYRSLTTAGHGPPASIAVDRSANTYATEYFSNVIDWFNAGGTDTPAAYDTPRAPGLPFYLAVDSNGLIYTSGWNHNSSRQQIDVCAPHMVPCHPCELVPGPSWPGGVALDRYNHLIVNNEDGSLLVYAAGCGALLSTYAYGSVYSPAPAIHFTDIALDTSENVIWGATELQNGDPGCSSTFCTNARGVHYAATALTATIGVFAPNYHTPIISGDKPGSGIAVWPPGPI